MVGISPVTPKSELVDDLALQAMDPVETADFYELIVERHQKSSTVVTSNRDPSEWVALMSDPLLAQSAIDRLVAPAMNPSSRAKPTGADSAPATPANPTQPPCPD